MEPFIEHRLFTESQVAKVYSEFTTTILEIRESGEKEGRRIYLGKEEALALANLLSMVANKIN